MLGSSHDSIPDRGLCLAGGVDLYHIRHAPDLAGAVHILSCILGRDISGSCGYLYGGAKEDGVSVEAFYRKEVGICPTMKRK